MWVCWLESDSRSAALPQPLGIHVCSAGNGAARTDPVATRFTIVHGVGLSPVRIRVPMYSPAPSSSPAVCPAAGEGQACVSAAVRCSQCLPKYLSRGFCPLWRKRVRWLEAVVWSEVLAKDFCHDFCSSGVSKPSIYPDSVCCPGEVCGISGCCVCVLVQSSE